MRCSSFGQCKRQGGLQVIAFLPVGGAEAATAEQLLKEIAETAAVPCAAAEIAEPVESAESFCSAVCSGIAPLCLELLAVLPVLAILIITLALVGITQHLVGLVNLLEPLLCLRVIPVYIGVVPLCQFAVGLFNLLLRCVSLNAQHLVVINESHNAFLFYEQTTGLPGCENDIKR